MATYRHRPEPSGLHAKMVRELSEGSPYLIGQRCNGRADHIIVRYVKRSHTYPERVLWAGQRDALPERFRGAQDPQRLLSRPSSD